MKKFEKIDKFSEHLKYQSTFIAKLVILFIPICIHPLSNLVNLSITVKLNFPFILRLFF